MMVPSQMFPNQRCRLGYCCAHPKAFAIVFEPNLAQPVCKCTIFCATPDTTSPFACRLTNFVFLHRDASAIQLVPYKWNYRPHRILRGGYFQMMAQAAKATYAEWANTSPQLAYFRRQDFDNTVFTSVRHPTPVIPGPTNKRVGHHSIVRPGIACSKHHILYLHSPVLEGSSWSAHGK